MRTPLNAGSEGALLLLLYTSVMAYRFLLLRRRWNLPPIAHSARDARTHTLLRRWRIALAVPLGLELVIVMWGVAAGPLRHALGVLLVFFLGVGLSVATAWLATRVLVAVAARPAPKDTEKTQRVVSIPLEPRRLPAYSNRLIEYTLGSAASFCIAALVTRTSGPLSERLAYPLYLAYIHAGLLLAKDAVVRWSTPLPSPAASEWRNQREDLRMYCLGVCDWARGATVLALLVETAERTIPQSSAYSHFLWVAVASVGVLFVPLGLIWIACRAQPMMALAAAMPVPALANAEPGVPHPVYFDADEPRLLVRRRGALTLNLAQPRAWLYGVYGCGLAWTIVARAL